MPRNLIVKHTIKNLKRFVPLALGLYFIPGVTVTMFALGLIDVTRNRPVSLQLLQKYFFGNGVLTWMASPFNLLIDLLCLPYRNRGIFTIEDMPDEYASEIRDLLDIFKRDPGFLDRVREMVGDADRAMVFFRWYGRRVESSVHLPGVERDFKYIRTIGLSVFNSRRATGLHFGPFRSTIRVLYNLNRIESDEVFIEVGDHRHVWKDDQLFIFDDTLMHRSVNESEQLRFCVFADIIRPSLLPMLLRGIVGIIQGVFFRFNFIFYNKWKFIK